MKNHWLEYRRQQGHFHWVLGIGKNALWQLRPRAIQMPSRPNTELRMDEKIRIIFSDVAMRDEELYTFLSEYCFDRKRTGNYAYLKLVDNLDQPIETWTFEKLKFEAIYFSDAFNNNHDGPRDIEVIFTYRGREYRDFLRKIEHTYNS